MEERHVEILLEDINGKFDLVLEGHDVLRRQMQQNHEELNEKIDLNTTMIKALNKKIDGVDQRLSAKIDSVDQRLSAKIDSVDQRLSAKIDSVDQRLSAKIDSVDQRLDGLDQRLDGLEQRLDGLEQHLGEKIDLNTTMTKALDEKIDGIAADLSAHRQDTELHSHYRVCEKP